MVSIICPSYNKGGFITETIKSVVDQTYKNWELLIVDDGSTDNSVELINEFCEIDVRVRLFIREGGSSGGSRCRNIGLSKAKGDYVVFLDADDVLDEKCLEGRLRLSSIHEKRDFYVFPIGTFYKEIGDSNSKWIPKGNGFLNRFLKHDLPWHTMSVLWDINFINNLDGFDIDYPRLQDVELHTRALLEKNVSFEIYSDTKPDAFYRIDDRRTNLDFDSQLKRQWKGVLQYLIKIGSLLSDDKQKKALRGTLFSFITTLNYSTIVKTSNKDLHCEVFGIVKLDLEKIPMFTSYYISYLKFYVFLYKKGFWKVKGFNLIMRFFFKF